MTPYPTQCRECGKDICPEAPDDAPVETCKLLLKSVVCNECADRHEAAHQAWAREQSRISEERRGKKQEETKPSKPRKERWYDY